MLHVKKEGKVLEKTSLEFENEGVLNPATIRIGEHVHMFYRAVRMGNNSTIGYCMFDGPLTLVERHAFSVLEPSTGKEAKGVEDPRIVQIEDTFYMTYTAFDGINALGALATSKDLKTFTKMGIVVPNMTYAEFVGFIEAGQRVHEKYYHNHNFYYKEVDPELINRLLWDKNLIFFPRRINGQLVFFHRIRPGIQIVFINELKDLTKKFWTNYFQEFHKRIVMDPKHEHEASYIGGGCPPIETEHGWVFIYHGVRTAPQGNIYSACVALLDLNDPSKELSRLPYPLFSPEIDWEINGEVNNVCFPTGTARFGDTLFIYYGAADERIACASVNFHHLVTELLDNTTKL
jgi:predicted GH43/DUF377 family glycosyl hydrolase